MSPLIAALAAAALTAPGLAEVPAAPVAGKNSSASLSPCPALTPPRPGRSGTRIVGGYQAAPETVPWQVELMAVEVDPTLPAPNNRNYQSADLVCRSALPLQCGGAMIAPGWVLTAAHCVDERRWPQAGRRLNVMTGSQVLSRPGPIHPILRIIVHEGYRPPAPDYDIALVQYDQAVATSPPRPLKAADHSTLAPIALSGLVPARLPEAPQGGVALHVSVTGWGRAFPTTAALGRPLGEGSSRVITAPDLAKDALQEADLMVVPQDVCQKQIDGTSLKGLRLTPRMFCAASADSAQPRDACSGDSGGPIFHKEQGRWILDGLVSFGDNDMCGKTAGVYTRLDQFAGWIKLQMGPDARLLVR